MSRQRALIPLIACVGALLGAMLVPTSAHADDPPSAPAGLQALWHLDEIEDSSSTPDESGNGRDASVNAVDQVPGRWGQAIRPDGTSGKARVDAFPTETVTVAAWVKVDGSTQPNSIVVSQGAYDCYHGNFALETSYEGRLLFTAYDAGYVRESESVALEPNRWHAVAGTFDGNSLRLFVDGEEVGTPTPTPEFTLKNNPGDELVIANYQLTCAGWNPWPGAVDEVHIYDRALSAEEITDLQTDAEPPAPTPSPNPPPTPTSDFVAVNSATSRTVLDASASAGATKYMWDLNGDERNDIACSGDQPVLGTRLTRAGTRSIGLTTVGQAGTSVTSSKLVAVTGPKLGAKAAKSVPQSAVCGKTPAVVIGGKDAPCADALTFGVIEVAGCLKRVTTPDQVPNSERASLKKMIAEFNANPQMREYVFTACVDLGMQDCRESRSSVDMRSSGTALANTDFYYSDAAVKVNGIRIQPNGSSAVVLAPSIGRIMASNASMSLEGIPLSAGREINLDVTGKGPLTNSIFGQGEAVDLKKELGIGPVSIAKGADSIGGFLPIGSVDLAFKRSGIQRFTEVGVQLQLPKEFNLLGGGKPPSGSTTIKADNARGLYLDALSLRVDDAYIGPVHFSKVAFDYTKAGKPQPPFNCRRDYWKATAEIFLGSRENGDAGLALAPPPDLNGIAFCEGSFKSAGGTLQFGKSRPQVFPGVFIDSIDLGLQLRPTVIRGGGTVSVADVITVNGVLLLVFASGDEPYRLVGQDAQTFSGLAGQRFTSTSVLMGGNYGFRVPGAGVDLRFANGYMAYSAPGRVMMGGGFRVDDIPLMTLEGGVDGDFDLDRRLFSVHGRVRADIEGLPWSPLGVEAWVTSKGVVVCGEVSGLAPGAGYKWGDSLPEIWFPDGCTPSPYWETGLSKSQGLSSNGLGFTVVKGERKGVKLRGTDAAPSVRVVGPNGVSVSTADGTFGQRGGIAVLRHPQTRTTYIGVAKGHPGRYFIEVLAGPNVTGMQQTRPGEELAVAGEVKGKGDKRALTYRIRNAQKRTITFYEQGAQSYARIGKATQGRGRITFRPALAAAGKRSIVAEVTVDGTPAPPITVTRYRVSTPSRPPSVDRLRVRRSGKQLRVRWNRVPGATSYAVTLSTASGVRRQVLTTKPTARLRVSPAFAATLSVRAIRDAEVGTRTTVRFTARREPKSRFLPYTELRKRD